MIDIESKVFDTIFNAVTLAYPTADVTTGFDEQVAIFPCVVVNEIDNATYRNSATDDNCENHARLTYEISVYTDNANTAKTTGKTIMGIVDDALQSLKFRRIRTNKPLNIGRTIFRQYGRWEVVVSQPVEVGDDTVYQLYRR